MKLSPRLQAIADLVPENKKIIDVGTDHGYIPVYLVENNISRDIIASDINEGPLESAKRYVQRKKFEKYIDIRLGSGLKVIEKDEVDIAIIAGMGGVLIEDILKDSFHVAESIDTFIFQPMVASIDLRKYLYENGFKIIQEKLAQEEDRIYEIIVASHGKTDLEDLLYLEIGKKLIENKDPLLEKFLEKRLKILEKILIDLEGKKSYRANKKYEEVMDRYKRIEGVKNLL